MSSKTFALSGLVLSLKKKKKKKVVVLILLSQRLSLLSVPVCSASGTLSALLCLFSAFSFDANAPLVGTVWSRHCGDFFHHKAESQRFFFIFCCRNSVSLAEETASHVLMDLSVISNKGGQSWLMTSCCKHTLDSYDKRWQQLAFTLASQLDDNTLSAQINVLAKQSNKPH